MPQLDGQVDIRLGGLSTNQTSIITLDPQDGRIAAGAKDIADGNMVLTNRQDTDTVLINRNPRGPINPSDGIGRVGQHLDFGQLLLTDAKGQVRARLAGDRGALELSDGTGQPILQADADSGTVRQISGAGKTAFESDANGHVWTAWGKSTHPNPDGSPNADPTARLDAEAAHLELGKSGQAGRLTVKSIGGGTGLDLDGQTGLTCARDIRCLDSGVPVFAVDTQAAQVTVGGRGHPGDLVMQDTNGAPTVTLDGQKGTVQVTGDVVIANADFAEDFTLAQSADPGTVLVLTDDGQLVPCSSAYDTRVAGVVSGAGTYRPGLILDRVGAQAGPNRAPVALVGKVCVRAVAHDAPIRVGDLLTTSDMAGHAMRASDRDRAFGAVLGKAMGPLEDGTGLIPMLIALQ